MVRVNPFEAIRIIFWDPLFSEQFSSYSRPQLPIKAGPLILIATGLALGFRAGIWNIGAEGQYIMGAILGAGIGLAGDILLTVLTNGVYSGNLLTQTGANMYSQELEAEADYVGLYYAKLAGYDISKSPYFWRKMASKNPGGIHLDGSTHPSTAKRFLALEQAIAEIDKKEKEGKPLLPDRQE